MKKSKEVWAIQEPGRGRPLQKSRGCQGPGTRLDFLIDFNRRSRAWSQDEAMEFVMLLKSGKTLEECTKVESLWKNFKGKNRLTAVKSKLAELRRAAQKGFTLQRYFKEGCPCRAGARVLASK